jgi:hypothetical protein
MIDYLKLVKKGTRMTWMQATLILIIVKVSTISDISVPYLDRNSQSLNTLNFKNILYKEDPGLTFGTDLTFNQ